MDKTRFKVLFDAEALYIAVELLDANRMLFRLVVNRDDMSIFRDDAISIKLDTANDRRTTLGFVLNPSDGRVDYRGIDEAQFRPEFDAVWTGASKRLAQGWSCEFRSRGAHSSSTRRIYPHASVSPVETTLDVTRPTIGR